MITVGMATYNDFDGVYFTVQSLRMHGELPPGSEILIIDNAPRTDELRDGAELEKLSREFWSGGQIRYIHAPESTGTAAPRDRVFREARNPLVLCIDCHVLLAPGAIRAFIDFFAANPESRDLVQGPMLYDDLRNASTHFTDTWGSNMWGQWGTAWVGNGTIEWSDNGRGDAEMRRLGYVPGHEAAEPFEIPAMGLGLFGCRKDAWLGFNPAFKGFGGEEWYIHTKYRNAGHKTWCIPRLQWGHRFARPSRPPKYNLSRHDTIRNYAVGLAEVGVPIDRAKAHFGEQEWGAAVSNKSCGCSASPAPAPVATPAHDIYSRALTADPDIAIVRQYSRGKVIEFAWRRTPPTVALMAANPERLLSHAPETLAGVDGKDGGTGFVAYSSGWDTAAPEPCDLLLIHLREGAVEAFARHASLAARVIVVGDPQPILATHRQWRVEAIAGKYVVLTRDAKQLPPLWRRAVNYLRARWHRWRRGEEFGAVVGRRLELRLATCEICPSRNGEKCGECGCPIKAKAAWPTETCPLGKWQ